MDVTGTGIGSMPMWWPCDIGVGIFFFILGITGAAIMVFIGGWDKLMAKSARIIEIDEEIKLKREIANRLGEDKTDDREKWERMINEDEDRLDKERTFNRDTGMILYVFIGGTVATILASNMIEAVAFGAGWTAVIGIFGIKKDEEKRAEAREETSKEKAEDMKKLEQNIIEFKKKTTDAYYEGFSAAIERIAKADKVNVEDIIEKIE